MFECEAEIAIALTVDAEGEIEAEEIGTGIVRSESDGEVFPIVCFSCGICFRPEQFTEEQRQWLEAIRDHIATSLAIEPDDFEYVPFQQHGGLGKAAKLFGEELRPLLNELNEALAA